MDEEFERFKRIPLHEYAVSLGFEHDQADSTKREMVMRRDCKGPGTGDKISISIDRDGHYIFYSFRGAQHGTIIDFVMWQKGCNMGEARKPLRIWSGTKRIPLYEPPEVARQFDRDAVAKEYRSMKDICWHDWLENERALPRPALLSERFKGRIKVDSRANVIFPHEDEIGLCGFERRNRDFKGFAELGKKGLWLSQNFDGDGRLVIGESAIDCISHAVVFPDDPARYVSFAGNPTAEQVSLIVKACQGMPEGSEIVCITHPDPDGDRYAEMIREAAGSLPFSIHRPSGVKDWNDFLQARKASGLDVHSFPAAL